MTTTLTPPFSLGVDTVQTITSDVIGTLLAHRFTFVIRYLWGRYAVTRTEVDKLLAEDLGFMPVTPSRKPGWRPLERYGTEDANKTLDALLALGLPPCTVWLDLEGVNGDPTDYVNAWSMRVRNSGFECGLYVGADCGLDADSLYRLPYVTRYWRSCSDVPTPVKRGFCMSQLRPWNVALPHVKVDVNVVEQDHKGGLPRMVVR